jgi:pyruvate dehydrogenase E2 component (dihydrolipoamide acetyltransferase)
MTGSPAMSAAAASAQRIRATPYARRLARERQLPLAAIRGTGPGGRITGADIAGHMPALADMRHSFEGRSAIETLRAIAGTASRAQHGATAAAHQSTTGAIPGAIVVRVDFTPVDALLVRIAELRPDVAREDICLKAAATAFRAAPGFASEGAILLMAGKQRRFLSGLGDAAVGAIAAMRSGADSSGAAALAVSFIGRAGVRPVAAQLAEGIAARLVVGAPGKDGSTDCLLSYDPARLGDQDAESCLAAFRDLVETPFRLLV